MAIMEIHRMGSDVLRMCAERLSSDDIRSQPVQDLIDNMIETASQTPEDGFITAGLAAPQVGHSRRIVLVIKEGSSRTDPHYDVLINPEVDITTTEVSDSEESCLSTPGLCGTVKRFTEVRVTYLDREGNRQRRTSTGDQAIYIQHECDHLDGVLWIDKVTDTKTIKYC